MHGRLAHRARIHTGRIISPERTMGPAPSRYGQNISHTLLISIWNIPVIDNILGHR